MYLVFIKTGNTDFINAVVRSFKWTRRQSFSRFNHMKIVRFNDTPTAFLKHNGEREKAGPKPK